MPDQELDVRSLPKPDKHPRIFQEFDSLAVGESFVLVNNHDPKHLRQEFDLDLPGSYEWDYLDKGPGAWRIRIGKLASTPLPRILTNAHATAAEPHDADAAGAIWKLQTNSRDLDSNIIHLRPDTTIETHKGPDLDVLLLVLSGAGRLDTELDTLALDPGALIWLPRLSRRRFVAGANGLTYLTVHQRRRSLVLDITDRP